MAQEKQLKEKCMRKHGKYKMEKQGKNETKLERGGGGEDESKPIGRTVQRRILTGALWHDPRFLLLACHYSITHSSSSLFRRRVLPHRDAGHAVAQAAALSLIKNSVPLATHCGLQVSTTRLQL
jgi:hypothetical protein